MIYLYMYHDLTENDCALMEMPFPKRKTLFVLRVVHVSLLPVSNSCWIHA